MKAMVSALAAGVSSSAFARWCVQCGEFIDCAIPIVLLVVILAALVVTAFGLAPPWQP